MSSLVRSGLVATWWKVAGPPCRTTLVERRARLQAALAGHSKLEVPTVDDGMASVGRDNAQTVVCAPFVLGVAPGAIVAGFDVHRRQITFDALDTVTGELWRGQLDSTPAGHSSARVCRGSPIRPERRRQLESEAPPCRPPNVQSGGSLHAALT